MNHVPDAWPRLSETLPGPRHPDVCQGCGLTRADAEARGETLTRWREHDWRDRQEHILVVLCGPCGDRLIEPHPRLYRALHPNDPAPGCMALCGDCRHREGTRCTHPHAKANGGPGVSLTVGQPTSVHVCRRGKGARSGWETWWPFPPKACQEKESIEGQTP